MIPVKQEVIDYVAANVIRSTVIRVNEDTTVDSFSSYYVDEAGNVEHIGLYNDKDMTKHNFSSDTMNAAPADINNPTSAEILAEVGASVTDTIGFIEYRNLAIDTNVNSVWFKYLGTVFKVSDLNLYALKESDKELLDPNYTKDGVVSFSTLDKVYARISTDDAEEWKTGYDYKANEIFWFTPTQLNALDSTGKKLKKDGRYFGMYNVDTTSTTLTLSDIATITTVGNESKEGLRGTPLATMAEMTALTAKDDEHRRVGELGFTFALGADITKFNPPSVVDDAGTGVWISEQMVTTTTDVDTLVAIKSPRDGQSCQVLSDLPIISFYIFNTSNALGLSADDGTTGTWNRLSSQTQLLNDMTPGATVTASGSTGTNTPIKLLDDKENTYWGSTSTPTPWWVRFQTTKTFVPSGITLYTRGNTTSPIDYTFEASTDNGVTWLELKSWVDQKIIANAEPLFLSLDVAEAYNDYRLVITKNNGATTVRIYEFEIVKRFDSKPIDNQVFKAPVADLPALKAVTNPNNGESRQLLSELPKTVIYRFIATDLTGEAADDGSIGSWIEDSAQTDTLTFISKAALASVDADRPTTNEFRAYILNPANNVNQGVAYYNGTDIAATDTTYALEVDDSKNAILIESSGPAIVSAVYGLIQLADIKAPINSQRVQVEGELPEIVFYVFNTTAIEGVAANDGTVGKWSLFGDTSRLRLNTLNTLAEMTALSAIDFNIVRVKENDAEYVFKLADTSAVLTDRILADDANTGRWNRVATSTAVRYFEFAVYDDIAGNKRVSQYKPNVKLYDVGDNFNLIDGAYVAPVDGLYFFNWSAFSNELSLALRTGLYVNGVLFHLLGQHNAGSPDVDKNSKLSVDVRLNAGDKVTLMSVGTDSTIRYYGGGNHNLFTGRLVTPFVNELITMNTTDRLVDSAVKDQEILIYDQASKTFKGFQIASAVDVDELLGVWTGLYDFGISDIDIPIDIRGAEYLVFTFSEMDSYLRQFSDTMIVNSGATEKMLTSPYDTWYINTTILSKGVGTFSVRCSEANMNAKLVSVRAYKKAQLSTIYQLDATGIEVDKTGLVDGNSLIYDEANDKMVKGSIDVPTGIRDDISSQNTTPKLFPGEEIDAASRALLRSVKVPHLFIPLSFASYGLASNLMRTTVSPVDGKIYQIKDSVPVATSNTDPSVSPEWELVGGGTSTVSDIDHAIPIDAKTKVVIDAAFLNRPEFSSNTYLVYDGVPFTLEMTGVGSAPNVNTPSLKYGFDNISATPTGDTQATVTGPAIVTVGLNGVNLIAVANKTVVGSVQTNTITSDDGRVSILANDDETVSVVMNNTELVKIDGAGDIYVLSAGSGIVLRSPGGQQFRLSVSDAGAIETAPLVPPTSAQ